MQHLKVVLNRIKVVNGFGSSDNVEKPITFNTNEISKCKRETSEYIFKKIIEKFDLLEELYRSSSPSYIPITHHESKLMSLSDWKVFINNCYLTERVLEVRDKTENYLLNPILKNGIPLEIRAHVYLILSGGFLKLRERNELEKILANTEPLHSEQIKKDLDRTHFPVDEKWLNRSSNRSFCYTKVVDYLKKQVEDTLNLYSLLNPGIGYVQGMNSVAAAIAYNVFIAKWMFFLSSSEFKQEIKLPMKFDSIDVFAIFWGIMETMELRKLYTGQMINLIYSIEQLEHRLLKTDSILYRKLTENNVVID